MGFRMRVMFDWGVVMWVVGVMSMFIDGEHILRH